MNRIYLVISMVGENEDFIESVEKAFGSIDKASKYKMELEDEEQFFRDRARMCRECGGLNKECPFYTLPTYAMDDCEAYDPYHDEVTYRIEEIEFEG